MIKKKSEVIYKVSVAELGMKRKRVRYGEWGVGFWEEVGVTFKGK